MTTTEFEKASGVPTPLKQQIRIPRRRWSSFMVL